MPVDDISLYAYPRNQELLLSTETAWAFFNTIAARGYYLTTMAEYSDVYEAWSEELYGPRPGRITDNIGPVIDLAVVFASGLSETFQQRFADYQTQRRENLSIVAFSTARTGALKGFSISLKLDSSKGMVYVSVSDGYFKIEEGNYGFLRFEHWLELIKLIYITWKPVYAYAFDYIGGGPVPQRQNALNLDVTWLYAINLWGPEVVDKFGREHVLRTPAWLLYTFEDGGILLVPDFFYYPATPPNSIYKAAAHLNLPTAELQEDGDEWDDEDE